MSYSTENFDEFAVERVDTENTHGTGCTFSAAITAYLARGFGSDRCYRLRKGLSDRRAQVELCHRRRPLAGQSLSHVPTEPGSLITRRS